ncbi:5-hydroxytryptamine receptor 5A [Biomphalaria pfeifferi]|uniref:5-hydroxytryptamine receptor 5A n=1 Tax=Biomphalaria pfeifferi TaxID=112525 RepID=A0AAD8F9Y1_BIOPF|nr:5-hydroxytryptamine receptor 5A [Biomphalaria pfeifferi]
MLNKSLCDHVSLDLSESSIRYTSHPHLLVVIAVVMCLMNTYIVGSNIFIIVIIGYSRHYSSNVNRSDKRGGYSDINKILSMSLHADQLLIGCFCIPLTTLQIVHNGRWSLGYPFCTVRVFVEAYSEIVYTYHFICICLDALAQVRCPLRYRLLTTKTGYGMVFFCWAIPLFTFIVTVCLGWHTEGIEDALVCLQLFNICANIFSKKFILFILPSSTVISLIVLAVFSAILFLEIYRIHQRRSLHGQIKDTSLVNSGGVPNPDGAGSQCSGCSNNHFNVSIENVEKIQSIGNGPPVMITASASIVNHDSHERQCTCGRSFSNTSKIKENVESKQVKGNVIKTRTIKTKRKAFALVISMATIYSFYLIWFIVICSLFVYDISMFPLWVISLVTSVRYLHSAFLPLIIFNHKTFQKLVRIFRNAIGNANK